MPTHETVHEVPMRWADLDSLNHVNNVVYVDYAAEARAELADAGLLEESVPITHMNVRFVRPLLLSRTPVVVVSTLDGDTLTQQICVDRDGERTVHARVVTTWAPAPDAPPVAKGAPSHAFRLRRSDVDSTGLVARTKLFELFQESRVLYIADHLTELKPGRFVVGTIEIDFHAAFGWRREPCPVRSEVVRVGSSSLTIESELSDGDVALAHCRTFLVGFDLASQSSRRFTDDELELFRGMLNPRAV